jgi:hypothetical protein
MSADVRRHPPRSRRPGTKGWRSRVMLEVESKVSNPNQAGTKTRIPAGWLRFLFWRMTISIF